MSILSSELSLGQNQRLVTEKFRGKEGRMKMTLYWKMSQIHKFVTQHILWTQ